MKVLSRLILAGMIFFAVSNAQAETGVHSSTGGPKGGRLLENTQPQAEFFIEKDLSVRITFYDQAMKPVAAAEQSVSVIAETGGGKTILDFEKKGDVLVSQGPLPAEHALNLVVRFKQTADAKARNFRFVYEDHICGECHRAEYACICGH